MKKNKALLAGICLATAFCGAIALQNSGVVSADVTAPTSVNDTQNHFFMETGAAVRKKAGSVGIRYTTYVSQEWYNLATQNGTVDITFYTDIDKDGNVDAGEARTLEAEEAVEFNSEYQGRTGLYKFTGAIEYSNLEIGEWTDADRTFAYNMQLEGQSYAVIDGVADPVMAYQNDNVRSMGEVADIALKGEAGGLDDYTATEEAMLAGYRTTANAVEYVDATYNTLNVGATYANANILKVSMADENDTYTAGTFAFDNDVATAREASDAYATVYTDKGIIETNFKVCTKVIKNETDWMSVFNTANAVLGYYYLANDIEDYPTLTITKNIYQSLAFKGVFDGGGHTASFTLLRNRGLFTYLDAATVKNVQFNLKVTNNGWGNATLAGNMAGLASAVWQNVSISDVYLKIEQAESANGVFAPIVHDAKYPISMTRTVIEMPDFGTADTSGISSFASIVTAFDANAVEDDWNWYFKTKLFVISELPLARNIKSGANAASTSFTVNAPNVSTTIDTTNKITYLGQVNNGGPINAYATKQALMLAVQNEQEDLTAYNKAMWDTSSGFPVFVGK